MSKPREITGRTVFIITASAFAVILGVNLYMATSAVRTFPGLEVKNSYVASQQFDDQVAAQTALGWTLNASNEGGRLHLAILDKNGAAVFPRSLTVKIGRPTIAKEDQDVDLHVEGDVYVGETDLADGKWYAYVDAVTAGGETIQQRLEFYVGGAVPAWTISVAYSNGKLVLGVDNTVGDPVFPKVFSVYLDRSIGEDTAEQAAGTTGEDAGTLQVRRDNQAVIRNAKNVELRIEGGKYVGDVDLGAGTWYAYVDATTPAGVQLAQRLVFTVTGGNE